MRLRHTCTAYDGSHREAAVTVFKPVKQALRDGTLPRQQCHVRLV